MLVALGAHAVEGRIAIEATALDTKSLLTGTIRFALHSHQARQAWLYYSNDDRRVQRYDKT